MQDVRELPAWRPVRESLAALRTYGAEVEEFVLANLSELDTWRSTIRKKQEEVDLERTRLAESSRSLDARRERLEQLRRTAETGAHRIRHEARALAQAREELAAQRSALETDGGSRTNSGRRKGDSQASHWAVERESLLCELADARKQVARLANLTAELAEARTELARARGEVLKLRERLNSRSHAKREREQELLFLREQHKASLDELAAARQREAEAKAHAEAVHKRLFQERATWLDELRRLRSVAESQASALAVWPSQGWTAGAAEAHASADPPLGAIIAELEQIESEIAAETADG